MSTQSDERADNLLRTAVNSGISDRVELAIFMGQVQVESANFTHRSENLNYSANRLFQIFRNRNGMETLAQAREIVSGGQKDIANFIYGGEFGRNQLGNSDPDDGWNFRGRGYIQLTGRYNYEKAGKALNIDLLSNPDLVQTPEIAEKTAIYFWKTNVVERGHQLDDKAATKDINPARLHLAERISAAQDWALKFKEGYLEAKRITPPMLVWPDTRRWEQFQPSDLQHDKRIYDSTHLLQMHPGNVQWDIPTQQTSPLVINANPYGAPRDAWELFQTLRTSVAQKHEEFGVSRTAEDIDRIAAAMTLHYYRDRMESMAHLQPSVDAEQRPHLHGSLVLYEKYPPTFVTNHSATNLAQALQTPVQESFDKLAQLQQERQLEAQRELTQTQTAGYEHPSLRPPGEHPQGPTIG